MIYQNFSRLVMLACLSVGIAACGGGGGGTSTPVTTAPPPAQPVADTTGVVAIALKDGPTDDFDSIMMTLTSVALLGNGAPVVLYEGEKTFDLLDLQNFYDMLAVSDQVPIGTYDKIRLKVSSIDLIKYEDNGDEQVTPADVPANGKIDLNPQDSFLVSPDAALLIEIDLDAKKSIHVVGTGSGRYKFRPVVFVDVQERQLLNGLVRVHGTIGEIADDDSRFELCDVEIQFTTRTNECVIVNLLPDETSLFDENGDPIDVGDIRNEAPPVEATVYGIAVVSSEPDDGDSDSDSESESESESESNDGDSDSQTDGDSDSDSKDDDTVRMVQIDAIVVQLGPDSAAQQLDGTVLTDIDDRNLFDFDIAPGQGFTEDSIVTTLLQATTVILSPDLTELDRDAIVAGADAAIAGVLQLGEDNLYKSTLIIIDDVDDRDERVEGAVLNVFAETFEIRTSSTGDLCIDPNDDARFYYFEDDKGVIQDRGLQDMNARLADGDLNSTVFGEQIEGEGCFRGDLIFYYRPDDDEAVTPQ